MGRDHRRAAQQIRRAGSGRECPGIRHQGFAGGDDFMHGTAGCLMRQKPRPGEPDLAAHIGQQRFQRCITHQLTGRISAQQRGKVWVFGMECNQPRADPPRSHRCQPCRAGHGGAGQNGKMSSRVFMGARLQPWQAPQRGMVAPAARRDFRQDGFWQADIGKQRLTAQRAPRQQQMTGLEAEEADGERCRGGPAQNLTRGAIQPRWHIHRDQGGADGLQQVDHLGRQRARQASAKERIHNKPGAGDFMFRKRHYQAAPACRCGCCGTAWAGRRHGGNGHRPARLFQITGRDVAIPAVIARARQHQGAAGAKPGLDRTRHRPAGRFHQTFNGETPLKGKRISARHLGGGQQFGRVRARHGLSYSASGNCGHGLDQAARQAAIGFQRALESCMAFVIAIAQRKGGAGKSTVAANLATALAELGHRVGLLDIDPQRSLARWDQQRGESKKARALHFEAPTGWRLPATLERLKREQDFLLLDTAPHDDTDARLAIRGADLVLVPLQPSAADLWSMDATLDLAKQERRPVRLLLNRVPAAGKLREEIEGQLRDRRLPVLDAVLGNRTAYAQAFMAGLGVVEAAPRGPAAAEVRALAEALRALRKKGI